MGNLLFSPSGRIGPVAFMKGAVILIAIAAVLGILPLVNYTIGSLLGVFGLVLVWCWIVLFIKRLHDAGKSGWMVLLIILVYIVGAVIVSNIVTSMFAADLKAQMDEMAMDAAEGGDLSAIFGAISDMSEEITRKTALPMAIGSALLAYAIAYVTNMLLKSDPNENEYGPATHGASTFD